MVIYVGLKTKIMMNQKTTPYKRSQFEKILNKIVIFQLAIQTGLCVFLAISSVSFENQNKNAPYSAYSNTSNLEIGSTTYFAFFILLNSLIPISMIVSLELVKFIQTFFVQMDLKMYSKEENKPAKVQSLSILEELGAVDYIFCDKTGTLTANIMEFKGCNIAGITYSGGTEEYKLDQFDSLRNMIRDQDNSHSSMHEIITELSLGASSRRCEYSLVAENKILKTNADYINEFLCALLLCNEVVTDKSSNDDNRYLSSSPDEVALIIATRSFNYEFLERTHLGVSAKILGVTKFFEILAVNEFSPERKRMSVLIKHPDDGLVRLYVKGADEAITNLLDYSKEITYFNNTTEALVEFAEQGLRTLNIAFKFVDNPDE